MTDKEYIDQLERENASLKQDIRTLSKVIEQLCGLLGVNMENFKETKLKTVIKSISKVVTTAAINPKEIETKFEFITGGLEIVEKLRRNV